MITITTGLPGHGKTLYTIEAVERLRQESGRPVYYKRKDGPGDYGIDELQLPWLPLADATKWFELPAGSIIVIDECQRLFVKRPQSGQVPDYVSKLETHRHDGFDLFLITQDAKNIDAHARRLIEQHWHVQRLYGTERFRLYTWQACHDPTRKADLALAQTSVSKLNSKFYSAYKSAEVHTVKRRLPWKWIAAVVVGFVVIPLIAIRVFAWFHTETVETLAGEAQPPPGVLEEGEQPQPVGRRALATWEAQAFVPRVDGWLWSAPFYDEVRPKLHARRVVGCMLLEFRNRTICKCSDGQGDAGLDTRACREWIAGHRYDPARPYEDLKAANVAYLEASSRSLSSKDSGAPEQSAQSGVVRGPTLAE